MQKEFLPTLENRKKHLENYLGKYPKNEVFEVGKSILGKSINCYKIGSGKGNILAVGAHHAMEYVTASVLYDFIDFIAEKGTRGESAYGVNLGFLLKKFTFWIIPCVNPDGVETQLMGQENSPLMKRQLVMNGSGDFSRWQANSRGVDLNHNYDAGFLEYKRIEARENILPGKTRFSGEYPESEPETRAVATLLRTLMPRAVVSFHTQGGEIFYSPKTDVVRRAAERMAHSVGYVTKEAAGYAAYGGLSDYSGTALGIPSFTVELGRGENPLPISLQKSLSLVARKLLITLPTHL